MMGYLANLDWWFFRYGPALLFGLAISFGWSHWTTKQEAKNLIPMAIFLLFTTFDRRGNFSHGNSFLHFSVLYFICSWLLIANRNNAGIILFSLGGIINAAVSILNGGKMPVLDDVVISFLHQPLTIATKMQWLCDWILTPGGLYMMSIGDFLAILGSALFFVHEVEIFWHQPKGARVK